MTRKRYVAAQRLTEPDKRFACGGVGCGELSAKPIGDLRRQGEHGEQYGETPEPCRAARARLGRKEVGHALRARARCRGRRLAARIKEAELRRWPNRQLVFALLLD